MKYLIQNLRAPQDPNGNPQRVWVVFSTETGETVAVFDEGYLGRHCVPAEYRDQGAEIASVQVPVNEYKNFRDHGG
jgi:hypothetical protein